MKDIYIERREQMLVIVIKNGGRLEECYIEEEDSRPSPGEIYKGIVKNIVPGIKCAFIDIGYKKNGYMYLDSKFNNTKIKKNDEVIVEVIKEEIGDKGAKVTNAISVPGRYAVISTLNNEINFSKSILNSSFKEELSKNIEKPSDVGITVRTNAEKVTAEDINNEIEKLYGIYKDIILKSSKASGPRLLYSDQGVLDKILRDVLDENTNKIIINNSEDFNYIKSYVRDKSDISIKLELHNENRTLLDFYGIEKELLNLRDRKIPLDCGGYLVIDKTEAMHVIDVNSGKNVKGSSIENTAYITNIEAAKECARQIRLRNLSGIIIIDFIDMKSEAYKREVLKALEEGFTRDKSKTIIHPFTELNLVQIARRRRGRSILNFIEDRCECCSGRGYKLSLSFIAEMIRNNIIRIHNEHAICDILIELDENYKEEVERDLQNFINKINGSNMCIYMKYVPKLDFVKVEPLIFQSQLQNMQKYKIYG